MIIFINFRRVDDAVGATAVHLVNGIWGQLSVGLFADPQEGLKGLFLGGGFYQLAVQSISAVSLMIWGASATLVIIWTVDQILPIRLSPEDEIRGCDISEHHLGDAQGTEIQKPLTTTLDKIISITTPIARRFSGASDERHQKEMDNFGHRKVFHTNQAFERDERL